MGRFYSLTCGSRTWSSQVNGLDDPGALDIEFDFFDQAYGIPKNDVGASTVTIYGIALQDIQQSQNFAGQPLTLSAGMSAGFPLANPQQRGLIMQGIVMQSFGNWIGTEMTLDFVVAGTEFTIDNPGNFVFSWMPGQSLQGALTQTIFAAYANSVRRPAPLFQLGGVYAAIPNGHAGRYSTLSNLAAAVNSMTRKSSPDGQGVFIVDHGGAIVVFDNAYGQQSSPCQIAFTDLVGQPTWVGQEIMQFSTVLRADIDVGTYIKMPQGFQNAPGLVTTTAPAFPSQLKYRSAFQGTFLVKSIRHVGNFRDPNGASWVSIFECVSQQASSTAPYTGAAI